jgi:tetratricopeptide (TPR) repeat protein
MEYKKLLAKDPKNQRALNNLAFLLVEEKNYPEAVNYAERAYKLSPNNPSILDTYGLTLFKKGSVIEAIKYFEKAYIIKPKSINIALHYAEALIKLNRKREASIVLARVISEDPEVKGKVATLQAII